MVSIKELVVRTLRVVNYSNTRSFLKAKKVNEYFTYIWRIKFNGFYFNFPFSCSEPWRMGTSLSVKGSGKARVSKVSKTLYFLRPGKNFRKTYFVLVLTGTGRYISPFLKKL